MRRKACFFVGLAWACWCYTSLLQAGCMDDYLRDGGLSMGDTLLILQTTTDSKCLDEGIAVIKNHLFTNADGSVCVQCEIQFGTVILNNSAVTEGQLKKLAKSDLPLVASQAQTQLYKYKAQREQQKQVLEDLEEEQQRKKQAAKEDAIRLERWKKQQAIEAKTEVPLLEAELANLEQEADDGKQSLAPNVALDVILPGSPQAFRMHDPEGLWWTVLFAGAVVGALVAPTNYNTSSSGYGGGYNNSMGQQGGSVNLRQACWILAAVIDASSIFDAARCTGQWNRRWDEAVERKQRELDRWKLWLGQDGSLGVQYSVPFGGPPESASPPVPPPPSGAPAPPTGDVPTLN